MKILQRYCLVSVFTLLIMTTTFAGDIATGGRAQAVLGDIHTPRTASGETVADIALYLLQTMISVF